MDVSLTDSRELVILSNQVIQRYKNNILTVPETLNENKEMPLGININIPH